MMSEISQANILDEPRDRTKKVTPKKTEPEKKKKKGGETEKMAIRASRKPLPMDPWNVEHVIFAESMTKIRWECLDPAAAKSPHLLEGFTLLAPMEGTGCNKCLVYLRSNQPALTKWAEANGNDFRHRVKTFASVFVTRYKKYQAEDTQLARRDVAHALCGKDTTVEFTDGNGDQFRVCIIHDRKVVVDKSFDVNKPGSSPQEWFLVTTKEAPAKKRWIRLGDIGNLEECFPALFVKHLLLASLKLDHMVGLDNVKRLTKSLDVNMRAEQLRIQHGVMVPPKEYIPLFAFVGNPGTGKTSVAEVIGQVYWLTGSLRYGHTGNWKAGALKAPYEGQTALKTQWAIEQAEGGVFFLDEAYSLAKGAGGYGEEALDMVTGLVEPSNTKCGLIVAGYEKEMETTFFECNIGIRSRFTKVVHFKDYTAAELVVIGQRILATRCFKIAPDAAEWFSTELGKQHPFWPADAGNARAMGHIVESMINSLNKRVVEHDEHDPRKLVMIALEDVQYALRKQGKHITLRGEESRKLRTFTETFCECESVEKMLQKEGEIRHVMEKYLPKVPDLCCLACKSASCISTTGTKDVYCTHCFFRMSTCPECRGQVDYATGRCSDPDCRGEIEIPKQNTPLDNETRLAMYARRFEQMAGLPVGSSSRDQQHAFYILLNRIAGLVALKNNVLLPAENERADAHQLLHQVYALFCPPSSVVGDDDVLEEGPSEKRRAVAIDEDIVDLRDEEEEDEESSDYDKPNTNNVIDRTTDNIELQGILTKLKGSLKHTKKGQAVSFEDLFGRDKRRIMDLCRAKQLLGDRVRLSTRETTKAPHYVIHVKILEELLNN